MNVTMSIYDQIQEAVSAIKTTIKTHIKTEIQTKINARPDVGLVLGSGLGDFAETLKERVVIPYEDIPHFKRVSVSGHAGKLIIGKIGDKVAAIMQGRYHYYEGHDIRDVVFPVRVLCGLGIQTLVLTNAAGGINPDLKAGDLMIIRDHINLMGVSPLRGENDDRLGPRFPDMTGLYDEGMNEIMAQSMTAIGLTPQKGVYLALSGPSYETPAEIRMFAAMGADAVGMSTVPEAIAARHMHVRVGGISCISNMAAGISKTPLSHLEVTETAERVKGDFIQLLNTILPKF
ncbi:MAG: purine-nucleoside phosphorylase [Candidatus Omnitrophota bacterium]